MKQENKKPDHFPEQSQAGLPGKEHKMHPQPESIRENYRGSDKLKGKIALITGGDSGIGRSVAIHFAREGADVAIVYLDEETDAQETKSLVEAEGKKCLLIRGDIKDETFCKDAVRETLSRLGGLNILVNNAGMHYPKDEITEISSEQFDKTFKTNIYSFFWFSREAVKQMKKGDTIINTTSVTAFRGSDHLLDYSATKGAILTFTRSLAKNLAGDGIRVNAVAPGPIWTPLIAASMDDVTEFGSDTPLGRAGQPSEVGPAFVFLASEDSSYITGQVIHPNGGEVIGA